MIPIIMSMNPRYKLYTFILFVWALKKPVQCTWIEKRCEIKKKDMSYSFQALFFFFLTQTLFPFYHHQKYKPLWAHSIPKWIPIHDELRR